MIQFILMDIEGTTTSIDFVHRTLFPYAAKHLNHFILDHKEDDLITQDLAEVKDTIMREKGIEASVDDCILELQTWIKEDRKHTSLKSLQGKLWKSGYETGQYKGHLYQDVIPNWKKSLRTLLQHQSLSHVNPMAVATN